MSKVVLNSITYAKCQDHYLKKINEISSKMNPPRTTLLINAGAETIIIPTLLAAGTMPIAAIITVPALAIAAGGYLGFLSMQKKSYRKVFLSIQQAESGNGGKVLDKIFKRVQRKNQILSRDEIITKIIALNEINFFCVNDYETGSVKLHKFNSFIKTLSNIKNGA